MTTPPTIDWPADFAAHPGDSVRERAARLGVHPATASRAAKRHGHTSGRTAGRPRKPGAGLKLWLRLSPAEQANLDAAAEVLALSREGVLRRLVRACRSALPGGGRDARERFDAALARITKEGAKP